MKTEKIPYNKIAQSINELVNTESEGVIKQYNIDQINNITIADYLNKISVLIQLDNLPKGINKYVINKLLIQHGQLVCFEHSTLGKFILPFVRTGGLNVYGVLPYIQPVCQGANIPELSTLKLEEGVDCAIIRYNNLGIPPAAFAWYFGHKISRLTHYLENISTWLRYPFILQGGNDDAKNKNDYISLQTMINSKSPYPVITDIFKTTQVIPIKANYTGTDIINQINFWKMLFYEYLGINNIIEKKEQMTNDEVDYNLDISFINRSKNTLPLYTSVEDVNKLLGWNIQIKSMFDKQQDNDINNQETIEETEEPGNAT